jgi:hypothetical protein
MTMRRKDARQLGAYPRRGTRNQRYSLGHDMTLL